MFRHVALFTLKEGTTPQQVEKIAAELRTLPGSIPELRAYHVGPDAGVDTGNWEFAVVADFDSATDYVLYRDHPAHQAIITEYIRPLIADRAAVQYEI
jgi:hypothetical protein